MISYEVNGPNVSKWAFNRIALKSSLKILLHFNFSLKPKYRNILNLYIYKYRNILNLYIYIFPVWCLMCNYRMVNCQNKARTTTQFSSGTLNVRGLTSKTKRECLDELFADYNLDVLCLQETKNLQSLRSKHHAFWL